MTPPGVTPRSAQILRTIRMSESERLVRFRPQLPAGTKIYRPTMALITAPDGMTFVPKDDVISQSGTAVVVRINGSVKTIAHGSVSFRNDISETYVPPNIPVPKRFAHVTPVEIVP